eukprot:3343172-Pleurochrysis_carterae.AAC.1
MNSCLRSAGSDSSSSLRAAAGPKSSSGGSSSSSGFICTGPMRNEERASSRRSSTRTPCSGSSGSTHSTARTHAGAESAAARIAAMAARCGSSGRSKKVRVKVPSTRRSNGSCASCSCSNIDAKNSGGGDACAQTSESEGGGMHWRNGRRPSERVRACVLAGVRMGVRVRVVQDACFARATAA